MTWILVVSLSVCVGFALGVTWCTFFRQSNDEYHEIERQMAESEDAL